MSAIGKFIPKSGAECRVDHYQALGFKTAIDDFGAGYSGLSLLADFRPDIIKLDMHLLRGIDPAESRANLDAILTRVDAEGVPAMLVGLPAPGNFGPQFQRDFGAMFPELAQEHGATLYPDLLAPITQRYTAGQDYADLMQDDQLHPSAAGVTAIVAAIGPAVDAWLDMLR